MTEPIPARRRKPRRTQPHGVKTIPTAIRMPQDLREWFTAQAALDRRTMSWLIVEVCRQYRAWKEATQNKPFA